ncbi:hypothetical protein WKK05_12120 [Nostoc sp. UHCC 0302]|uniref:hypothetical protein n=1 Tax=Nostoc sp. UHCC 0302 TaxID=3134896 RepID=UPI00311C8C67
MSQINNDSEKPRVIILDEFADMKKYLERHPNSEEILQRFQKYYSQLLRQVQNKKD